MDNIKNNSTENENIFNGYGVEIKLKKSDDFLKVKETLTRLGVTNNENKTLYQSCHILHKRDKTGQSKYAIVHFKEMFKFDNKPSSLTENDIGRRNTIVKLLTEWNLIEPLINLSELKPILSMTAIKVLAYKDKDEWNLISKYNIGNKKNAT